MQALRRICRNGRPAEGRFEEQEPVQGKLAFRHALVPATLLAMVATTPGAAQDGHTWRTYVNDRFGQSICYPADLVRVDRAPANDDGRSFTGARGARIATWASYNAMDWTLATSFEQDRRRLAGETGQITYKVIGRDGYVLSGRKGHQVFYSRTALVDGTFGTLEITYPEADAPLWDAVTSRVSGCFRPPRAAR